jgi:hypothetical protein
MVVELEPVVKHTDSVPVQMARVNQHPPAHHSLKMDGIPTENTFFCCCIRVVYSYPCMDVPYTHKCLIHSRHLAALGGGRRVWAMRVVLSAQVARNGLITWVETVFHANQLHWSSRYWATDCTKSVELLLLMGYVTECELSGSTNQLYKSECRAAAYVLCHRG